MSTTWRETHRDHLREYHARWRAANRERLKASYCAAQMRWYKAHPVAARAKQAVTHANARARKAGVDGELTFADVLPLMYRPCHYCGRLNGESRRERVGIDHVIAMANGGPNVPANIVPCCVACNHSKKVGAEPRRGKHWQRAEAGASPEDLNRRRREAYALKHR